MPIMNVVSTVIFNDLTIDMECLAFSFTTPYPFASNRLPRNPRECQSRVLHFSLGCCIVYIGEANVIERGWDGEIENRNVGTLWNFTFEGESLFLFLPKTEILQGYLGSTKVKTRENSSYSLLLAPMPRPEATVAQRPIPGQTVDVHCSLLTQFT